MLGFKRWLMKGARGGSGVTWRRRVVWCAAMAAGSPVFGQTWDGGGASGNWSDAGNWNPDGVPPANAAIIMAGAAGLNPNVDVAWGINSLRFDATAGVFVIGGSTLTIGNGGILNNSGHTQTINNDLVFAASQTVNAAGGGLVVNGNVASSAGLLTITGGLDSTINGRFVGGGALTKTGSGVLTINSTAASTYSNLTALSGGGLRLIGGHDMGRVSIGDAAGVGLEVSGNVSVAGLAGGGVAGGNMSLSSGLLTINSVYPTNQSYYGIISGPGGLVKSGTGTQVLAGASANTYSGTTTVNDGVLILKKTSGVNAIGGDLIVSGGRVSLQATGQIADSATVFVNGGTLELSGGDEAIGALAGSGGVVSFGSASSLVVGSNNGSTSYAGKIQGDGRLTKAGSGVLTLSGNITANLQTSVEGGTLRLTSPSGLGPKSSLLIAFDAALDINTSSAVAISSLAGSGKVTLSGGSVSVGGSDASSTFGGVISGAGGLSKVGAGALVLTGANTYGGSTTIAGGTLSINSPDGLGIALSPLTLGGGTLQIANGMTFGRAMTITDGAVSVPGGYTVNLTGSISGNGALKKTDAGTLILSGNNTHIGGVLVAGGTVSVSSDGSLGAAGAPMRVDSGVAVFSDSISTDRSVTVAAAAVLEVSESKTLSLQGVAALVGAKAGAGTLELSGSGSFSGNIRAGAVRVFGSYTYGALSLGDEASALLEFNSIDASAGSLSGGGRIVLNGGSLAVNTAQQTTYAGTIGGSGALAKAGGGRLVLLGANTYSGSTRLDGGELEVTAEENLGDLSGSLSFNGGVLRIGGTGFPSTSRVINWSGNGGGFDIADPGGVFTLAQSLSGIGSLSKSGPGSLMLAGKNGYRGATRINGGTLRLGGVNAISSASAVELADAAGAVLDLGDNSVRIASLSGGGAAGGNVNLGSGTLTIGANNGSTTFGGAIRGMGGLVITGSGVLTLTGVSSYTGQTSINGGTLAVIADGSLGSPEGALNFRGGTLRIGRGMVSGRGGVIEGGGAVIDVVDGQTAEFGGSFAGDGGLTKAGPGTLVLGGANSYTGGTTIAAGVLEGTTASLRGNITSSGTLMIKQDFDGTYAGGIGGIGSLVKNGSGTVGLAGNNTYTGETRINGGVLLVSNDSGLGHGSAVNLANSAGVALHVSGCSPAIARLSGGGAAGGNLVLTDATLTVGGGNESAVYGGSISGNGRLVKTGYGSLVLAGGNTGSGRVVVGEGSLVLAGNNAIGDRSPVELADSPSAVLDLNGTTETIGSLEGGGVSGGDVLLGSGRLIVGPNDASTTYSGAISGAGGVTKIGSGILCLEGNNTHKGGTRLVAGAVEVTGESQLGSGVLSFEGGALRVAGTSFGGFARPFAWTAAGGGFDIAQPGHTFTIGQSLTGPGTLNKLGPGALVLGAPASYTGPTRILEGTLRLPQGMADPGGTITVESGGELVTGRFVNRPLAGRGRITANGLLMIGEAGSTTGFDFDGTLNVGANTVILLDADAARLGGAVLLEKGGKLVATSGMILDSEGSLTVAGGASIEGSFTNRGAVACEDAVMTLNGNWTSRGSIAAAGVVNNGIFHVEGGLANLGQLTGFGTMSVASGQELAVSSIRQVSLVVGEDAQVRLIPGAGGAAVSRVDSFLLDLGSTLDLADNDLIVEATAGTRDAVFSQINAWIESGRRPVFDHTQAGRIISSMAGGSGVEFLTAMLNDLGGGAGPVYDTFRGQSVDVNSILIMYRVRGDANLDGVINADDYFLIDLGYMARAKGYRNGDFNTDGVINADDYFIIDLAFIRHGARLSSERAWGATAVPEGHTVIPMLVGLCLLRGRRRREGGTTDGADGAARRRAQGAALRAGRSPA